MEKIKKSCESCGVNGISFVCKNVSPEAKAKLDKLMKAKEERLKKMVEDYRNNLI